MQTTTRFKPPVWLLSLSVMILVIIAVALFEWQNLYINNGEFQQLTSSDALWLLGLFLLATLAFDFSLSLFSSVVAVLAATSLGFWPGTMVIWLGLMLSCCGGYWIGMHPEHRLVKHFAAPSDIKKAQAFVGKLNVSALVCHRGVPILAEVSTIAAGLVGFPWIVFLLICAISNAGLAVVYGYIGAEADARDSILWVVLGSMVVSSVAWLAKALWQRANEGEQTSAQSTGLMVNLHADFDNGRRYSVLFEDQLFKKNNPLLRNALHQHGQPRQSVFVYIDSSVERANLLLAAKIKRYFGHFRADLCLMAPPQTVIGGQASQQPSNIQYLNQQLQQHDLDEHSCVLVIGGDTAQNAVTKACSALNPGVKILRMSNALLD